jgi:hypothetical protein
MKSNFKDHIAKLPGSLYTSAGIPRRRVFMGYLNAKQWYYAGKPIISDVEFDKLEDCIKELHPDCPILKVVGAPTRKDGEELNQWINEKENVK